MDISRSAFDFEGENEDFELTRIFNGEEKEEMVECTKVSQRINN